MQKIGVMTIKETKTVNINAAAVVRQPYNPMEQFHPWAVGLSHRGSRNTKQQTNYGCSLPITRDASQNKSAFVVIVLPPPTLNGSYPEGTKLT